MVWGCFSHSIELIRWYKSIKLWMQTEEAILKIGVEKRFLFKDRIMILTILLKETKKFLENSNINLPERPVQNSDLNPI